MAGRFPNPARTGESEVGLLQKQRNRGHRREPTSDDGAGPHMQVPVRAALGHIRVEGIPEPEEKPGPATRACDRRGFRGIPVFTYPRSDA